MTNLSIPAMESQAVVTRIPIYVMQVRCAVMRNWIGVMRSQFPTSRNLILASQFLIVVMFAAPRVTSHPR